MVSAVGLEPACKRQTKDLTEHSWCAQRTDFRNQFCCQPDLTKTTPGILAKTPLWDDRRTSPRVLS